MRPALPPDRQATPEVRKDERFLRTAILHDRRRRCLRTRCPAFQKTLLNNFFLKDLVGPSPWPGRYQGGWGDAMAAAQRIGRPRYPALIPGAAVRRATPCVASKINSPLGAESNRDSPSAFFAPAAAARGARGRIPGPKPCLRLNELNPRQFFCPENACRLAVVAIQGVKRVKPESAYAETRTRPSHRRRKRKNPARSRVLKRRKTVAIRPTGTSRALRGATPFARPCSCAARPSGRRA
jgi:hypothetical protein